MTLTDGSSTTGSGYQPADGYDEAYGPDGTPRPHYRDLMAVLAGVDLEARADRVGSHMRSSGATFGEGETFRLDPVPRLLTALEWAELETGLAQRVRALDAFVADVYGERRAVEAGLVPARLLEGIEFLEPDLSMFPPPHSAWISIAGLDVVRGADGHFRVLEDNV